jgi:hypothetical protein
VSSIGYRVFEIMMNNDLILVSLAEAAVYYYSLLYIVSTPS